MKKIVRTVCIILAALLVLSAAVFTVSAVIAAKKVYDPERRILRSTPDELGLYFDGLEIPTENGKISAWFIPAQEDRDNVSESMQTVIISHNYSDNREMNDISLLYTVKFLCRNGLNVVMFDYTGSGSSDGKGYSFGQKEETDELCAVTDKVKELIPDGEIILYGLGFGAAPVIETANEKGIEKIIADSLYADLPTLLSQSMSYFTGVRNGLFNSAVKFFLPLVSPVDYSYPSPAETLEKTSGKKILLIYGQSDSVLPSTDSQTVKSAAEKQNDVKLWLIPDCEHLCGMVKNDYNYRNVLLAFIKGEE